MSESYFDNLIKRPTIYAGAQMIHFRMTQIVIDDALYTIISKSGDVAVSANWMFALKDSDIEDEAAYEDEDGYLDDSRWLVPWGGEVFECHFNDDVFDEEAWLRDAFIYFS